MAATGVWKLDGCAAFWSSGLSLPLVGGVTGRVAEAGGAWEEGSSSAGAAASEFSRPEACASVALGVWTELLWSALAAVECAAVDVEVDAVVGGWGAAAAAAVSPGSALDEVIADGTAPSPWMDCPLLR